MSVIEIKSVGQEITTTNFYGTPEERGNKYIVSPNAGAFRLLMPRGRRGDLKEMVTAKECLLSRGPHPGMGLRDAVEFLFEDGTDNPFCLPLSAASFTHLPLDSDAGKERVLTVWYGVMNGKLLKVLTLPCWYRRSPRLPDLRPR